MDIFTYAMAKKAGGGGGGDTYETVAEIAVGTMEEQGGMYIYSTSASAPSINRNSTYYLNDASYPNDDIAVEDGDTVIAFNTILGEQGRIDPNKPFIVFEWNDGSLIVVSDTDDAENTTVRILKKVSGGGGSNNIYRITGSLDTNTGSIYNASATPDEVIAAAQAGKIPVMSINVIEEGIYIHATFSQVDINVIGTTKTVQFRGQTIDSGSGNRIETVIYNNGSGWNVTQPVVIPAYDSANEGDKLTVDAGGELEWA